MSEYTERSAVWYGYLGFDLERCETWRTLKKSQKLQIESIEKLGAGSIELHSLASSFETR